MFQHFRRGSDRESEGWIEKVQTIIYLYVTPLIYNTSNI